MDEEMKGTERKRRDRGDTLGRKDEEFHQGVSAGLQSIVLEPERMRKEGKVCVCVHVCGRGES